MQSFNPEEPLDTTLYLPRSYTMSTKQGSYPVNTPDTFISAESFDSTYFISAQHAKPTRTPRKEKSRKFFQQVQPTFCLEQPTNTIELEFLDNFDPAKDIVVRRKAREWVNKNKGHRVQIRRVKPQPEETREDDKEERQNQLITVKSKDTIKTHDPLKIIGVSQKDPFGILPDIGRKYDHIIDFFLSTCPEEVPCSDDKYAQETDKTIITFSQENTILWNVSKSRLSFTLWLFATVSVRGGLSGNNQTEEIQWFYSQALRLVQETLKKETETGRFSDPLISGLACIMATACYSGMFSTAVMHRDAMVRMLAIRGEGSIAKGFRSIGNWGRKSVQWCELMVAAQIVEVPKIPYQTPYASVALPPTLAREASRLAAITLSNLPPLSAPLQLITGLLHQLALSYAYPLPGIKIDSYIITPLYNVEYSLLQVLAEQKQPNHGFSDVEVLLAETYQMFFWTGPRQLPSQMRLCDLFVSRVMKALLPLLLEAEMEVDVDAFFLRASSPDENENTDDYLRRFRRNPRNTNNVITWSLALGTIVSATFSRPEHLWFKGRLQLQLRAMGLYQDEEAYLKFLNMFPSTDGFAWINLKNLPD